MKRVVSLFFMAIAVAVLAGRAQAADITVAAAVTLKSAFEEIAKRYHAANPGSKVRFTFGASGDLMRQIAAGAPVDVFASAAQRDMDELCAKGLVLPGSRADFAKNRVVLVTNKKAPLNSFSCLQTRVASIAPCRAGSIMLTRLENSTRQLCSWSLTSPENRNRYQDTARSPGCSATTPSRNS